LIGRWVPRLLLDRNFSVHLVGRDITSRHRQLKPWLDGCSYQDADLLQGEQFPGRIGELRPSHLLHLAWQMEPASVYTGAENTAWVEASLRLIRTFAGMGGKRVVVAGSCAEYDWSYEFLDEESTPRKPSSPYGIAKASLRERLSEEASDLDVTFAWPHIFSCFGPGERAGRLVPDVISALLMGKSIDCTDGTQERDYLYAADVARALVEILDGRTEGCLNVASGQIYRVRDIVELISQSIGGAGLVRYGARPRSPSEPARIVGSTRRLTEVVGFKPRYSLKEGIDRTVEFYRQHGSR